MMKTMKKVAAVWLLFAFCFCAGIASMAEGGAAAEKDEVVYAVLFDNGEVRDIYVVNRFSLPGGGELIDYGDYTSVVNLTDLQPVTLQDGMVTAQTERENFYYQGYFSGTDLPWLYTIEYRIDGAVLQPESLAGMSGHFEIRMTSSPNGAVNSAFYDNYMQQITITLDSDGCGNISADGATMANAGKNRVLAFTVLPQRDADITVTADVTDFEMEGISITAMPFSMNIEMPDMGEILGNFTLLANAVAELNDGVGKLKDGVAEMASGSAKLKQGSSVFMGGLSQAGANGGKILDASGQIKEALSKTASSLSETDGLTEIADLVKLPEALTQLAGGLDQVSDGIKRLKDGYGQAFPALDMAIMAIPGHQITEEQINGLYAEADEERRALIGQLAESYMAALTVKETYEQVQMALSSVEAALNPLSVSIDTVSKSLHGISAQIDGALSGDAMEQIQLLPKGLSELSESYAGFHSGLNLFIQGVSALSNGYSGLDEGIAELSGVLVEVSGGMAELYDGTNLLVAETSTMPEMITDTINTLVGDYIRGDFEAVSFTSDKNDSISFVQFVIKTEGIQKPTAEKATPAEAVQQSFWDRLSKLFGK